MNPTQQTLTIPQAIELAIEYVQAGDLQQAEFMFRQVLEIDKNNCNCFYYLGVIAYELGRFDEAISSLQRLIVINPSFAQSYKGLADCYSQQNRLNEALVNYQHYFWLQTDCTLLS